MFLVRKSPPPLLCIDGPTLRVRRYWRDGLGKTRLSAEAVLDRVDENTVHELNEFRLDMRGVVVPSVVTEVPRQLPMDHLPEGSM